MDSDAPASDLAALLGELKDRSGLSYAELAQRTFTTRSTLHRYCSGAGVPRDYAIVAAVARECRATPDELIALSRHWTAAVAGTSSDESTQPTRRKTLFRSPALLLALCALLLLTLTMSGAPAPRPALAHRTGSSGDEGDQWTENPWAVGAAGFGVTLNSNTGVMPGFRVGSVRFWDGHTRWADLEPHRTVFDWSALDRLVEGARRARLPALFTLGGTPAWAAPDGPKSLYADGSRTTPPDRPADWDIFVQALVSRYRGKIEAYELWDTATDRHFYSGSPSALASMVRRAARIIHTTDPHATVVCPSMGRLRQRGGSAFMRSFAQAEGFQPCDVIGVKMRQAPSQEPPESMVTELTTADETLHDLGVAGPVWDTGPDYDVRDQPHLNGARGRDYAVRFFLASLYGRQMHLDRAYFYDWGGDRVPIVLQPEGQDPTSAARAVATLQTWLSGARIRGCGHGRAAHLAADEWQCHFTHVRSAPRGADAVIRWTTQGTATTTAADSGTVVHHLDGTSTRVAPGATIEITGEPVLLVPVTWP